MPKIISYLISVSANHTARSDEIDVRYLNSIRLVNKFFSNIIPVNYLRIKTEFALDNELILSSTIKILKEHYATYQLKEKIFHIEGYGPHGVEGVKGDIGTCSGFSGSIIPTPRDPYSEWDKISTAMGKKNHQRQQQRIMKNQLRKTCNNRRR